MNFIHHTTGADHGVNFESSKILMIEPNWFKRCVKRVINIKLNRPPYLNCVTGEDTIFPQYGAIC